MHETQRIREALAVIPVHDRETWVRMGMAVKSELGDDGFDLWDTWSQRDETYNEQDALAVWKSLKAVGGVTGGTLFHEAQRHGYRPSESEDRRSAGELEAQRRARAARQAQADAERASKQAIAAKKASAIFEQAEPAATDHPYLVRKGIGPNGARQSKGRLVLPMTDRTDNVHSLQFISGDGAKKYLADGAIKGHFFLIGPALPASLPLCIAEGFATAATIHEATGYPVAVAFDAGNLRPVAQALADELAGQPMIVCGDDDWQTTGNPGRTKANEAARAVGALVALPDFGANRPEGATDFNDLASHAGPQAVRDAIERARAAAPARPGDESLIGSENAPAGNSGWPEPQSLTARIEPEPYPADALPEAIRAAVQEVAGFVKAPLALVASSALGALSLAAQARADVRRADRLEGPAGLFMLTIADSGERKTTCDGFFAQAIRDFEAEQAELAKPALKNHAAAIAAWNAEREGILSAIKDAGKKGKPADNLRTDLAELEHAKPEPPRVPRLIFGDATPEALTWALSKQWPSAGVISSEAGSIFGSHGMGRDSIMRNLGILNQLWDGARLTFDRRTSESYTVRGARLTVALQTQEATLRDFLGRAGALARGSGFLARFMVAWPESTQGQRSFTEAPASWPALAVFNRRLAAILAEPVAMDDDGALSPPVIGFAPDARRDWIAFHDNIEAELGGGGELHDVRDVAAKAADNAARLAGLFHAFEGGGGAIGADAFAGAARIVAWHLSESRRFFGELALPAELADAARLDAWLIEHCQRERVGHADRREAQRGGPVRDGERLTAALRVLAELDRVREGRDGKRKLILLNPALRARQA